MTKLPGFPTDSYINFAIVVCFVQGALFAAITAGTELASDIQKGFLDRLSLTPARRWTVLVGATFGGTAVSIVGSVVYLGVGLLFGVTIESGVLGAIVLVLLVDLHRARVRRHRRLARDPDRLAGGGAGDVPAALRPLLPLDDEPAVGLHREGLVPARSREVNPISFLIDGMRGLILDGWDMSTLLPCIAVATGILVVSFGLASRGLRKRVQRT